MKIVITMIATAVIEYKKEGFDIDENSSLEDQQQSIREQSADGVRNYPIDFIEQDNVEINAVVTLVE